MRRDHTLGTIIERLARVNGLEATRGGVRRRAAAHVRPGVEARQPLAGGIAAVIEPGDRVVIATANGYEMLLLCLAASRAGGVPVPSTRRCGPMKCVT